MGRNERRLTLYIDRGIVCTLTNSGNIETYRQREIQNLTSEELSIEISSGRLAGDWYRYPELPKNISIFFEDETIMGRARVTYPYASAKKRLTRVANKGTGTRKSSKV